MQAATGEFWDEKVWPRFDPILVYGHVNCNSLYIFIWTHELDPISWQEIKIYQPLWSCSGDSVHAGALHQGLASVSVVWLDTDAAQVQASE